MRAHSLHKDVIRAAKALSTHGRAHAGEVTLAQRTLKRKVDLLQTSARKRPTTEHFNRPDPVDSLWASHSPTNRAEARLAETTEIPTGSWANAQQKAKSTGTLVEHGIQLSG